jgi:ABC-type phosphate/phosphonate transport system ATPase subunit
VDRRRTVTQPRTNGQRTRRAIAHGSSRREIGVVFQQFNLVGRVPVLTNVLVGLLDRRRRLPVAQAVVCKR